MNAYDFNIAVPRSKGRLANLAEELGRENISLDGLRDVARAYLFLELRATASPALLHGL
jgi:hypothetical protein